MQYDFRRFAPATKAVEQNWCTSQCSGDAWQETGYKWGTNTAPLQVRNAAGLIGVRKPGVVKPDNVHLAATEKIVADLAYLLGLPVPPVTLWDCGDGAIGGRHVAVSAWAFQQTWTWGQVKTIISSPQAAALVPAMSAMAPFEAWIDARDRENEGNVLVSFEPTGRPAAAWIDYAFSLDYIWNGSERSACAIVPHYPPFGNPIREVGVEVADRIAGLDRAMIEQIVNRIPAECLPQEVAESICSNLLARRASVRALWQAGG